MLCPKLKLDYGVVKHTGLKPGSKAAHFCKRCFKLVGDKLRVCLKNGYWSGKPPVCKSKFLAVVIALTLIVYLFIIIVIDCGLPPKPDYGSVSYKSTKCGSKAYYSCDYGYLLTGGSSVRKCQPNGYWSGKTPKCLRRKY